MEYANLSRGILCPHYRPAEWGHTHIQSTHCEQKQWSKVVAGAGTDLLYRLAVGETVTVHDMSEKPRPTRALWQGLEWIRYAAALSWGAPYDGIVGRGGRSLEQYFDRVAGSVTAGWPLLGSMRKYYTGGQLLLFAANCHHCTAGWAP